MWSLVALQTASARLKLPETLEGFWKPKVNCIRKLTVFQNRRGNCNLNSSEFQLHAPVVCFWHQGRAQIQRGSFSRPASREHYPHENDRACLIFMTQEKAFFCCFIPFCNFRVISLNTPPSDLSLEEFHSLSASLALMVGT